MRFLFLAVAAVVLLAVVIPAVIAVTLAAVSVVGAVLPWVAFGLFFWVLFGGGRAPRRQRWQRQDWRGQPKWGGTNGHASQPPPRAVAPVPPKPQPPAPAELPIDIQVKTEQIRRKVEVLLGYASSFPLFSQDLFLVRQTADEYLPRTINAYLALAASGGAEVVTASGKSARQELSEQLDLLDTKLDEIASDLQHRDQDRLLANRRFLEERFGHRIA